MNKSIALPMTVGIFLISSAVAASPGGELDASFGLNGRLHLRIGISSTGASITQQADGKLIVAGTLTRSERDDTELVLMRLDVDGSMDESFGDAGIATLYAGAAADMYNGGSSIADVIDQADGKILVAATIDEGFESGAQNFAVARFNPDGTPDASFGDNGVRTLGVGGLADVAFDLLEFADGSILIAGTTNAGGHSSAAFARLAPDGTVDDAFGSGSRPGIVLVGDDLSDLHVFAVSEQADGRIVACGTATDLESGWQSMLVMRLNEDGSVDPGFGNNGVSIFPGTSATAVARDCLALEDGTVLLAGYRGEHPDIGSATLARVAADGRLDATFADLGWATVELPGTSAFNSLVRLDDRLIVATGRNGALDMLGDEYYPRDMLFARFFADSGELDASFGHQGMTLVDFGATLDPSFAAGQALIRQSDGKLIAAGTALYAGGVTEIALARIDPDGNGYAGNASFVARAGLPPTEENGQASVEVRRTGGSTGTLSVNYSTEASSATAPGDYIAESGVLTWPDGDMSSRRIFITLVDDAVPEPVEAFFVKLENSSGGVATSRYIVQIAGSDRGSGGPSGPSKSGGGAVGIYGVLCLFMLAAARLSAQRLRATAAARGTCRRAVAGCTRFRA